MTGKAFEREVGGRSRRPRDAARRTRSPAGASTDYVLAIDPEMFAGATNEVVCAAMEAEGIPAEVQYPSMNRYELFQPALSRLPVAVEFADRLDMQAMSFPVAEAAGQRESVYFYGERLPGRRPWHQRRRGGAGEDPTARRRTDEALAPDQAPKNRGRCASLAVEQCVEQGHGTLVVAHQRVGHQGPATP